MALTAAIFTSKPPPPLCSYLFFLLLCIFGFYTLHHPHQRNPHKTLDYYHDLFLSTSNNSTIATYLRALTLHPHLAGTAASLDTTHYVYAQFQTLGLKTHQTHYETLLSYPVHSSLAAHFGNGTHFYFNLSEKGVAPDVVPPYHAYSPSGSAYANVVFVNFGREEDYLALGVVGVNVSGCVVIARKGGGLSRGGVVRVAEANGALAVLLYTEGDKGGGVERGTVMSGVGDPQSPGWAGVEGGEKLRVEDSEVINRFPKIPSMPLSLENAEVILGSLAGPAVPQRWRDSLRSRVSRVGPGPTIVNFTYQAEKKVATIQNVFATIRGIEEPDRYVLLGNHRDAWTYGAVDPNSGTAALLDVARRYALLMRMGWNPRRTIVFCSWDAEEFGMIGSTEWVEQNLVNLNAKAVTYLNVDCAVQGPGFFTAATPQLDNLLIEVTKKVKDPDMEGATVYEELTTTNSVINIQRLSGVESDFAPFLHYAGIPSIDIYYGGDFPVYHTAFDSYDWITTYADPLFQRHVAVAGVWGLLALRLADDSVLPFNYLSYADQLQRYKGGLSSLLDRSISLEPLTRSIQELASAAKVAEDEAKRFRDPEIMDDFGVLKLRALNDRLMRAERGFLDADGLQGRQWFKHLIYGPHGDYENKLAFFPGIADAIHQSQKMIKRDGNAVIQSEIWRVARAIGRAASALTGELT